MQQVRSLRSQALDLLRFPLAVVIVTIHVFTGFSTLIHGEVFDFTDYPIFMGIILFCKAFLSAQSVPIYFFIAGYVFFLGINLTMETYWRKLRNRFKSLFIPYLIWNSLTIISVLIPFLPSLHSIFPGCDYHELNFSLKNILSCFWMYDCGILGRQMDIESTNPIDGPLWFVRDLMIMALLTPAMNQLFKKAGITLVLISGLLWFCLANIPRGHIYQLLTATFFFSFGAYLSFHKRDMVIEFRKYRTLSFITYPLIASYLFIYSLCSGRIQDIAEVGYAGTEMVFIKNIGIVCGLFFAYNIAVLFIERLKIKSSKLLSTAAFFLYAGHWLIIGYVKNLLFLVIPPITDINVVIVYALTDILICIGLLLLFMFLRKFTPRFLGLLTGGRF